MEIMNTICEKSIPLISGWTNVCSPIIVTVSTLLFWGSVIYVLIALFNMLSQRNRETQGAIKQFIVALVIGAVLGTFAYSMNNNVIFGIFDVLGGLLNSMFPRK